MCIRDRLIPLQDKIEKFLLSKGIVKQRADNGKLEPTSRLSLLRHTDLEIVTVFDAELRGICNYYHLASNYRSLNYFSYLMEYSCLKTLSGKHRCKPVSYTHLDVYKRQVKASWMPGTVSSSSICGR